MRQPLPNGIPVEVRALAAAVLAILLLHGGSAAADGLVGLYAGAAFGESRVEADSHGVDGAQVPCCQSSLFRLDRTDTHFAVGIGAQYKISTVAIRTEYERFESAGEHPSVWTLGLTWTFL
jgi:hypothetical protein